jgi:hypothetical protein
MVQKHENSFWSLLVSNPEEIIDALILSGGLEFAGVDPETGEPLYRPTSILESIDPKLSKEMSSYFSETTMKLWEKGFIDMDVTIEDPLVKLAEKAFDLEAINLLDKNERVVIKEIIRVLSEKK